MFGDVPLSRIRRIEEVDQRDSERRRLTSRSTQMLRYLGWDDHQLD
jgi:hypothetical protein